MTLSTHVYLLTEADPADVFMECRRLLGATDAHPWRRGEYDDRAYLTNELGIGLDALMSVNYREGALLKPTHGCDGDCDEDCSGAWHEPAHWLYVDFDTAYGYHDEAGRGCGSLHAKLVAQLGGWLDDRGVRWAWRNEFTGEVHVGDRYERLFDLIDGGDEARVWFQGIVMPLIGRMVGGR